jgi:tetratricopeptide (TPR) repeat protein
MLKEIQIKAEQLLALSYKLCTEGNPDDALAALSKGQALLDKYSRDISERHLYFNFLNDRYNCLFEKVDEEGRRIAAEEATKYYNTLPRNANIIAQCVTDTSVAQMHSYLGNIPKAIHYANRIDIDSPKLRESSKALSIFVVLFRLYQTTNVGYAIGRLRKILIFIKDNLEGAKLRIDSKNPQNEKYCVSPQSSALKNANSNHDLAFCVDDLLEVYAKLARLDLDRPDPSSCLSWCDKGWALAKEAALKNCDTDHVFSICTRALTRSREEDCIIKWCCNTLDCLKAMLAQSKLTTDMAKSYVIAQRILFSACPGNDFLVLSPLIFQETIENDPSIDEFFVVIECWLCGFLLSRVNGWSNPKGREAYSLISKSLRLFDHETVDNEIYAHALGLFADAHLAQGKAALAVQQFTEAERIISELLGKDHVLSKQYQAGLEKALAQTS